MHFKVFQSTAKLMQLLNSLYKVSTTAVLKAEKDQTIAVYSNLTHEY